MTTHSDAICCSTDGEGVVSSAKSGVDGLGSSGEGDRVNSATHANGTGGHGYVDGQVSAPSKAHFDSFGCSSGGCDGVGAGGANKSEIVGRVCTGVLLARKDKGYRRFYGVIRCGASDLDSWAVISWLADDQFQSLAANRPCLGMCAEKKLQVADFAQLDVGGEALPTPMGAPGHP